MKHTQILTIVRVVHAAVYLVMVASIAILLYSAIVGYFGAGLWIALALLAIEGIVFLANGLECPVSRIAIRYGSKTGDAFDWILSKKTNQYLFRFFASLTIIGVLMLALRVSGIFG